MELWDKVKTEIDRAGRIAQDALDEGKIRIEAFRARQHADSAAQSLGYAVFRARQSGIELDTESYARLSSVLAGYEAEIAGYEARLAEIGGHATADAGAASEATPPGGSAA